jgi:hypothetical protein
MPHPANLTHCLYKKSERCQLLNVILAMNVHGTAFHLVFINEVLMI